MKNLSLKLLSLILGSILVLYGFYHHISSSEFWPLSISKTWLQGSQFEYSMLQKPLFSMGLALLHLLPLNDVEHIYVAKMLFSLIGMAGIALWALSRVPKSLRWVGFTLIALVVCVSPILLQNFFRIRSDQLSFFFFALSAFFYARNQKRFFLAGLGLLFLTSVKSGVFLIPGLFLFNDELKNIYKSFSFKKKLYLLLSLLAVCIWFIAINISSLFYFVESYGTKSIYSPFLFQFLLSEWPLLLFSVVAGVLLLRNSILYKKLVAASVLTFVLIVIWPQPLPFFIASLALIVYLPITTFILAPGFSRQNKALLSSLFLLAQILNVGTLVFNEKLSLWNSNEEQFKYISVVSKLLERNQLSYLDGTGIFPRQKMIPCFISPGDEAANAFCRQTILHHETDSVVITQRLSFLGTEIFQAVEKDYTQVKPNFWLKNDFIQKINPSEIDLISGPVPMFIFGFD